MLNEHSRNVVVQIAIECLRNGDPPPDGLDEETKKAVEREIAFYKQVIDEVGEEEFSKMTIDVGYDYD